LIEQTILRELMRSEGFARKAGPHLKSDYFPAQTPERVAFEIINEFAEKYNALPSDEAVGVMLSGRTDLSDDLFRDTGRLLKTICEDESPQPNQQWLLDQTEAWCKDRALANAFKTGLAILNEKGEKNLSKGSLPKIFEDALAITFDASIGHDYTEDAEDRFRMITQKHRRTPFDLSLMNKMTKGGLVPKTLNVVMAVSGAGKSLFMSHCAANNLMEGKNVLYITLELSQEMVGTRIDANLMNVDIGMLESLPRDVYLRKMADLRSKTSGKLIIKEYAPRSAGATHFRSLINDLRTKKGFVPDIIYVDYLNICAACSGAKDQNSYERVKTIAEELRALAVEFDVPLFTATQTNRSGYDSTDVGMENTSDSIGLPMTADLLFALIASEELDRLGQYMVQQLKSRYDDINRMRRFYIGVDKPKMRLFDTEQTAQEDNAAPPPQPTMHPTRQRPEGFKGFK
jgi:KaiC/GvpD/RAD55 family RecA-like ATPase